MHRAIFIDKDGTLIPDIPYNVDPVRITLMPGAGDTLRRLAAAGYRLVVVSNQSGVARGCFTEADLLPVRARLEALLDAYGVRLDGFYYCPHCPDGTVAQYAVECDCRKPRAGMLRAAAADLNLDLSRSWMVGDIAADSEAGNRAGCRTILIEKPYDLIRDLTAYSRPDFIVSCWAEAGEIILSGAGRDARPEAQRVGSEAR